MSSTFSLEIAQSLGYEYCEFRCYSSKGKAILTAGSEGIPQSNTTQQTSDKKFIGKDKRCWLPLKRSSMELSRRQTYIGLLVKGGFLVGYFLHGQTVGFEM